MKNPTPYLKMRVLGAVETAPGHSRRERTRHVSSQVFRDEEGHRRLFEGYLREYEAEGKG